MNLYYKKGKSNEVISSDLKYKSKNIVYTFLVAYFLDLGIKRRHRWIRTIVKSFADSDLTARTRGTYFYSIVSIKTV